MKAFRWLIVLVLFVATLNLACDLPFSNITLTQNISVTEVDVEPHVGNGAFSVKVYTHPSRNDDVLTCTISADSGNVTVYTQAVKGYPGLFSNAPSEEYYNFTFTYAVPGTHDLVCGGQKGGTWSDSFVVLSLIDTAQPGATATAQVTATENTPVFTDGGLLYYGYVRKINDLFGCLFDTRLTKDSDAGSYLRYANGVLEGSCSHQAANYTLTGSVKGTVGADGAVAFTYTGSMDQDPGSAAECKVNMSFTATGSFTAANLAKGSLNYNEVDACDATQSDKGTTTWVIQFFGTK